MAEKRAVRVSKFLALVLRHDPGSIGLELDPSGWADIDQLLAANGAHGLSITREELEEVARENPKQRFTIDASENRIRANQGHSLEVDLGLAPVPPPEVLYHGTAWRVLSAILAEGLQPMGRQHVHLSGDAATAVNVARRHGTPIVLAVESQRMHQAGHEFFLSANGVWLTDHVPSAFVRALDLDGRG
ncbi:MAG TPA: RNA 2'-phosphotransferase [Acidimicrobiia bacterium]